MFRGLRSRRKKRCNMSIFLLILRSNVTLQATRIMLFIYEMKGYLIPSVNQFSQYLVALAID